MAALFLPVSVLSKPLAETLQFQPKLDFSNKKQTSVITIITTADFSSIYFSFAEILDLNLLALGSLVLLYLKMRTGLHPLVLVKTTQTLS